MSDKFQREMEEAAFERGKREASEHLGKIAQKQQAGLDISVKEQAEYMRLMTTENIESARARGDKREARNLEGWLEVLRRH